MPWRRTGFWPHRRYIILVNSDADETGLTAEERKEKRISEAFPMILEFENWLQNTYLLRKVPYYERDEKDMTEFLSRNWVKFNWACSEYRYY